MASLDVHTPEELRAALTALGRALGDSEKYALVGGGACAVLGSTRGTQDIDFVVCRGRTTTARQLLRASSDFEVEARTNHILYKAAKPIEFEILTPSALF